MKFDVLPLCPTPVPEPIPHGMRPILESVGGGGSWLTLDNSASYNPPIVIRNAGNYPLTIYDIQQVFQDGLVEIKVTNLHALRDIPPGEARRIEMAAYTLQGRAGQPGYNLALLTNDPVMPISNHFHYEEFF